MDDIQSLIQKVQQLTKREQEVLDHRGQGKTIKEVAQILHIRERTVKFHLANIYEKLGLQDLTTEFERLDAIREYRRALAYFNDLQQTPSPVEPPGESSPNDEDDAVIPTHALVLVLEDEIELAEKMTAVQRATLRIPPEDEQSYTSPRKFSGKRVAVLLLSASAIAGILIGASITALLYSFRYSSQTPVLATVNNPSEQMASLPTATLPPTVVTATVTVTEPAVESTRQASLCGETNVAQYEIKPTFLRNQGVSVFNIQNTVGAMFGDAVRTVALDERGLWLGYLQGQSNSVGGVALYTRQNWINCAPVPQIASQTINDIEIDKLGRIWIATEQAGISMFDGEQWHTYTTDNGLPSNAIFGLTLDEQGKIWAATLEGVAVLDEKGWQVPYSANNDTLVTNKVHALAFDSQGNIWVGHIEAGVSQYNNTTGTWTYYTVESGELGGHQIRDIVVRKANADTPESVWFATADGGVTKFEQEKWTTFRVQDGLPSDTVIDIALDKYNRVWLATAGGVSYLEDGTWVPYNTINTLSIAFGPTCQNCPIDDDHVWTGTSANGLTHSRLPHLNNDEVVKVEEICFELIMKREETCVELQEGELNHLHTITATYPFSLTPGDKLRFRATLSPHAPYQLREDRGDFLSNMDVSDENLFSAWPQISVKGTVEPGQPFTFVENHYPFVAPVLTNGEQEQQLVSTWRTWMRTRYVGPVIRLVFVVKAKE